MRSSLHFHALANNVVCQRQHLIRGANHFGVCFVRALADDHVDHFFNDTHV